jgi:hypothetical protein
MWRILCLFGWHRPARGSVTREIATPVSLYRGRCRRCGRAIYRDQKTLKWKKDGRGQAPAQPNRPVM